MASFYWGVMFVAVVAVGILFSFFLSSRQKLRMCGIQLLQAMRMLIKHLQVHRGLMATYLVGDKNIKENLIFHADSVVRDIKGIVNIDENFTKNDDWRAITEHWARLSSSNGEEELYDNYEQHSKLIISSLDLMIWISKEYNVDAQLVGRNRVYWYELLCLGEKLGQLRALGTIFLTSSSDVGKKRKSLDKIKNLLKDIEDVFKNKALQQKIGGSSCDEINMFLASVEHYMFSEKSWLTGEQYFARATEIIEIVYQCFDEEMQVLIHSY